ncbi:mammalian cell entry protein [Mycobacterium arosiense ATCC BAA-1401 = DSM 45069]|uniref:Mammalian cell entry protein n=2 Tax=Mycobacterium arosiense TaxID=425468 RepID=A0A1W9ZBZ7_MYCAI|nr:mammalian cell entry protein [Mycobacterium arosiense ATCC BAA-1401 = DSM 45069]
MSDSVGLYTGNPVTQMGYAIGQVKAITPGIKDVRVDFTVNEHRPLPLDVKAIIRSTSILADRSLEVVGNYEAGPKLRAGECIPLGRTATPKSLSEVIGSSTTFINSVNPAGSRNIGDVVRELDQATHNNGVGLNQLLTTSSRVLDSPDQAISDISTIITNLAELSSLLRELRGPLKQSFVDADQTNGDVFEALEGTGRLVRSAVPLISAAADIDNYLGDELQFTLDTVGTALRKLSAHAPRIANLLNVGPPWINALANYFNGRAARHVIRYRPPMYRIRTPDGVALCNMMNASVPGSCANVQGEPYAVDVALLQYALNQAHR